MTDKAIDSGSNLDPHADKYNDPRVQITRRGLLERAEPLGREVEEALGVALERLGGEGVEAIREASLPAACSVQQQCEAPAEREEQ